MTMQCLTHWGQVMHICISKLTTIGSDNGLSPNRRHAIIWTNAGILFYWTLRNKLQWNLLRNSCIFIRENAFENVIWKIAAILSRPQCVKLSWQGQLQLLSVIVVIQVAEVAQIAKFMGPTWGPPGSCRPHVGPMLAPWTSLSGRLLALHPITGLYVGLSRLIFSFL